MRVLITGIAGFIGFHAAKRLSDMNIEVAGLDNLNTYYDPELKRARLRALENRVRFYELGLSEFQKLSALLQNFKPDVVLHLAAQAGVRYSIENPFAYGDANLNGHLAVIEACRNSPTLSHLVYASSSSVYGANTKVPFSETDPVHQPVSLYAATKRSGELMSESYARLYGLRQIGLRFFTVYGPWGRPDMAYWLFTEKMLSQQPIRIFNHGKLERDFTYIEDIIDGVVAAVVMKSDALETDKKHRLYNLGNNQPVALMDFITTLEEVCGVVAQKIMEPMQMGDVNRTFADIEAAGRDLGFQPKTQLRDGLTDFVNWYREYQGG